MSGNGNADSDSSIFLELKKSRKLLLDFLEASYGQQSNWCEVRAFVLRIFGNNGLEGVLKKEWNDDVVVNGAECDQSRIYNQFKTKNKYR